MKKRGSYREGLKYCGGCRLWMKTKSVRCPYCNRILRERSSAFRIDPEKYLGRDWERCVEAVSVKERKRGGGEVIQPSEQHSIPV